MRHSTLSKVIAMSIISMCEHSISIKNLIWKKIHLKLRPQFYENLEKYMAEEMVGRRILMNVIDIKDQSEQMEADFVLKRRLSSISMSIWRWGAIFNYKRSEAKKFQRGSI